MNSSEVINLAIGNLTNLIGRSIEIADIIKPPELEAAVNLFKTVSKLSPLVANQLEFHTIDFLNTIPEFQAVGRWRRQDPGFPDAIFDSEILPPPGLEIKAWFPLATEITARFKDSQNHFSADQIYVVMIAWLPEYLIYGKPKVIDILFVSGKSIAKARDIHYHKPPDYLVIEPEDTSSRTANLQQTNTNGYKFQGSSEDFEEAKKIVDSWGPAGRVYEPTPEYQTTIRQLVNNFNYRLDTNFAKMDRIEHPEIEQFKRKVYNSKFLGLKVQDWIALMKTGSDEQIRQIFHQRLAIK